MRRILIITSVLFLLFSCASKSTPDYSQEAVLATTILKQETLALMERAKNESYQGLEQEIQSHIAKLELEKNAVETRSNSDILLQEWNIMLDPDEGLVMGFFEFWKTHPEISLEFVDSVKENVAHAFDIILQFESALEEK